MLKLFNRNIQGVGFNLRLEVIDQILRKKPKVEFLEIITENWFEAGPHHQKLLELRKDYKILFHCVGMNIAGVAPLNKSYLKKIKDLADKFEPYHISDHLCFQSLNGVYYHDLLPFPLNQESFLNVTDQINEIQDFFQQQIIVENLSYYVEYKSSNITESQFLTNLAKKTNCGILLDLNNIWVNQQNLQIPISDYLSEINFDYVKEIHMAGAELTEDTYVDTHGLPISSELLNVLSSLRTKIKGIPIIFEKDCNITSLKDFTSQTKKIEKVIR